MKCPRLGHFQVPADTASSSGVTFSVTQYGIMPHAAETDRNTKPLDIQGVLVVAGAGFEPWSCLGLPLSTLIPNVHSNHYTLRVNSSFIHESSY